MHLFRTLLPLFVCVFLPFASLRAESHAKETTHHSDTHTVVHTYGGGDLLQTVFNALSMTLYGDAKTGLDKTFTSILRLVLSIGGFCCICLAFFREKFEPLIRSFFLPALAITSLLLTPRTTVYIQDHLIQKTASTKETAFTHVSNVPFFMGKFISVVSTASYHLQQLFTKTTHGTQQAIYNWTGDIYAGRELFRAKKCRIANADLESNFREFCRECVFRDLGIGLYSKEELSHAPHILDFLEKSTSNIRTVRYKPLIPFETAERQDAELLTCRQAMHRMNQLFQGKIANTKDLLFGEIGNDASFLLSKQGGDIRALIQQQVSIDTLKEELPGTLDSFAARRAAVLQRENQKTLGALGVYSIVAMRNYFEAIIYLVFPIIALISLVSFGIQPLIQWMQFVLWVNLWPIFYVLVDFLLNSIWEARAPSVLGASSHLTLFTSDGLSDLYGFMESTAAIALAFIPFLSWILLKGGVSQMVHLASSLTAPAQAAASTAAAEKVSGNYSFGNLSLDNVSGYNTQMFKQTYSGSLSQGSLSIDDGAQTLTYTPANDELYVKQGDSYLREGISRTQGFNKAVQDSFSQSEATLFDKSHQYSHSLTDASNKAVGFVQDISTSIQKGENISLQETTGLQTAAQYIQGVGNDYAQSKGISHDQAMREVLAGGIGLSLGIKGSMDLSYQDGVSNSSSSNEAHKSFDTDTFQKSIQTILNASSGEVAHHMGTEGVRLHNDMSESFNTAKSASEQLKAAHTQHESLAKVKSYTESDNVAIQQGLNQRFVDFLRHKYQDSGKVMEAIDLPAESETKMSLFKEFAKDFLPRELPSADIARKYEEFQTKVSPVSKEEYSLKASKFQDDKQKEMNLAFGKTQHSFEELKNKTFSEKSGRTQEVEQDRTTIIGKYTPDKGKTQDELKENKSTVSAFYDKATSVNFIKTGLQKGWEIAKSHPVAGFNLGAEELYLNMYAETREKPSSKETP